MTSDATPRTMREMMRGDLREMSSVWWWFLLLGILWTLFGMFVLSYRVGSLTAVGVFVGVALLFGGITQFALATWAPGGWRWPGGGQSCCWGSPSSSSACGQCVRGNVRCSRW